MLIGREGKLDALEKSFAGSQKFAVIYGSHRCGKTSMITAFAAGKKGIVFSAEKLNSFMNLRLFEKAVSAYSGQEESFPRWKEAFARIADFARDGRFLLAIDDFADLVYEDGDILKALENAFDTDWRDADVFVLGACGRPYFTESVILSETLPKRPVSFKIDELDYYDSAKLLPEGISSQDKLRYYCCLGGIPEYLKLVKGSESFEKNIRRIFLTKDSPLYRTVPEMMLDELREPDFYNSILFAIADGARRINEVVARTGESSTKVNKYLLTLLQMQIVSRDIPFGEDPATSRKGIYSINSKALSFWYRFVLPERAGIIREENVLPNITELVDEYIESKYLGYVCEQYMLKQNKLGNLPILSSQIAGYWESLKDFSDARLIAANQRNRQILFGTYRVSFDQPYEKVLSSLRENDRLFSEYWERFDILFSLKPFQRELLNMQSAKLKCVTLDDMYK